ncbi:MAG: DUF333 domain-containing protein [Patescibacteria group bacterium]|jgi:hypothetical protein
MIKETNSSKIRGLALKITFILVALAFLGLVLIINIQVRKSVSFVDQSIVSPVSERSVPVVSLANPASTNCVTQGGTSKIETKADGSQFGICYFEDNRQCEEWALFRGNCPIGGLKVTGYITPAAVFCAISGGKYQVTNQNAVSEREEGVCTLPGGEKCDVWKFYDGSCPQD